MNAEVLRAEVTFRTSRSSGPGGQHANVTDSRVEALLDLRTTTALSDAERTRALARLGPTVTAVAQEHRSQLRNRQVALERLETKVRGALHVPKARRATRPTRGSQERRLQAKKQAGETKRARRRPPTD